MERTGLVGGAPSKYERQFGKAVPRVPRSWGWLVGIGWFFVLMGIVFAVVELFFFDSTAGPVGFAAAGAMSIVHGNALRGAHEFLTRNRISPPHRAASPSSF